ncbi:MAG: hypothetical protein PHX14_00015, partial [Syntrophomonadaceae bacterium]|nr:hypothetical protein [Syntrophomonadaceae bacterium]
MVNKYYANNYSFALLANDILLIMEIFYLFNMVVRTWKGGGYGFSKKQKASSNSRNRSRIRVQCDFASRPKD